MKPSRATLSCVVSALVVSAGTAHGADTVETWDAGATDVDFYLGFDNAGAPRSERAIYGDIMIGYGIVDRFSAYLGTNLSAPDHLSRAEPSFYLGVFGTIVETAHVDLDLFLDVGTGGAGMSKLEITPALELNFDLDPEMSSWGLYLRASLVGHGHELPASTAPEAAVSFAVNPGAYWMVADGHQLLLEYDMDYHPSPGEGEQRVDTGGFAFGYNLVLDDAIELVTQLHVSVPEPDEPLAMSVMVGFIATLPSVPSN